MNGTLAAIVQNLAPIWADSSVAATTDGKMVLAFLLDLVASVHILPPEDEDVLSKLNPGLLPAIGTVCTAVPELQQEYPCLAGIAMRAMLEDKTMPDLCRLAEEVSVNIDSCSSKDDIIQVLLACGKDLFSSSRSSGKVMAPEEAAETTQDLALRDATTDGAALVCFYDATGGTSWRKDTRWGTSAPLGNWYGVTADGGGRVVKLSLGGIFYGNNLTGGFPLLSRLLRTTARRSCFLSKLRFTHCSWACLEVPNRKRDDDFHANSLS